MHDFGRKIDFYCWKKSKKHVFSPKIGMLYATYDVISGNHSNRPTLNMSQNLCEGWTTSYWKRQVLIFYPLGKNSEKLYGWKRCTLPPPPPPCTGGGLYISAVSSCWTVSLSRYFILEWICFNDWAKSRNRRNPTDIILLDFLQIVLTVFHRDVFFINQNDAVITALFSIGFKAF